MDTSEPRPVCRPMGISREMYYCLDCGFSTNTAGYVEMHWKTNHGETGEEAIEGSDYAQGWQLVIMQERRDQWIEDQSKRFEKALVGVLTPHDFVAEAEIRDA